MEKTGMEKKPWVAQVWRLMRPMKTKTDRIRWGVPGWTVRVGAATLMLLVSFGGALVSPGQAGPRGVGDAFEVGGRRATLAEFESLPFVDSEYTRRFVFDTYDNPKLHELRERFRLEEVVAPGRDEFDRQVLLMDWTHRQFTFGRPSTNAEGAIEILRAVEGGHTFFCKQYAEVLVSASAALGWVSRPLALRRHRGVNEADGSTEHSVIETWSNQYRKWVMFDPTSRLYLEREGLPLGAYEIREEWFRRDGAQLTFVIGRERRRYRRSDLPIVVGRFAGFGELAIHRDELDKYGFIGYILNSNLMDAGYAYDRMFIVKDELCAGTSWHVRPTPSNPAVDPYFPVGQASLRLDPAEGGLRASLQTLTPNLDRFEVRLDGSGWRPVGAQFEWAIHAGRNELEVRAVNRFGVPGAVSRAVVTAD